MMRSCAGLSGTGEEVLSLQEAVGKGLLRGIWAPTEEWLEISKLRGMIRFYLEGFLWQQT